MSTEPVSSPSQSGRPCNRSDAWASWGRGLGFALFLFILFVPGLVLPMPQRVVLGIALWMALWWITSAVPLYVTAFLPMLVFPLASINPFAEVVSNYSDRLVYLLMGGFILAKAIEKTGLHERFALATLLALPSRSPAMILWAFMLVTASISAWLCNTATTLMILPMALSVIGLVRESEYKNAFAASLLLGIAHAAAWGGMATLIGSPPNVLCASIALKQFSVEISFLSWMMMGVPVAMVGLTVTALYLSRVAFPIPGDAILESRVHLQERFHNLGRMTRDQKLVLFVFIVTASAWLSHAFWKSMLPMMDDAMIAMIGAMTLFILPSADKGSGILAAEEGMQLPWGVLIVIGGGLALASGFKSTGLDSAIAAQLEFLEAFPPFIVLLILMGFAITITQFMVNTAAAALLLPVASALAHVIQMEPALLLTTVAIGTSISFVLPIGTPPNMVVLGTGHITTKQMARVGVPLSILLWLIISLLLYLLVPALT